MLPKSRGLIPNYCTQNHAVTFTWDHTMFVHIIRVFYTFTDSLTRCFSIPCTSFRCHRTFCTCCGTIWWPSSLFAAVFLSPQIFTRKGVHPSRWHHRFPFWSARFATCSFISPMVITHIPSETCPEQDMYSVPGNGGPPWGGHPSSPPLLESLCNARPATSQSHLGDSDVKTTLLLKNNGQASSILLKI